MNSTKTVKPSIKNVYKVTFRSLKDNPPLLTPFIIFAILEFAALILTYLIPRMPLRLILGPPIATFWGERFLHYPFNFLLLPKLTSLNRMALSIIFGSLLTGMAVAIISDIYNKKHIKLEASLKIALKKYLYLFIVIFIMVLLYYILVKIITVSLIKYFRAGHASLLSLKPDIWMGPILSIMNFIIAVFIQAAFIYAIPVIIIEKGKLLKSITKSFALFKKLFMQTLTLVGLPMLIYIPVLVMQSNSAFLIDRLFPEVIFLVASLSIIINSLVIDPLVTASATFLYLMNREG